MCSHRTSLTVKNKKKMKRVFKRPSVNFRKFKFSIFRANCWPAINKKKREIKLNVIFTVEGKSIR